MTVSTVDCLRNTDQTLLCCPEEVGERELVPVIIGSNDQRMRFWRIMASTNIAGARRFFGQSLVVAPNGEKRAQPLCDETLPTSHRLHPMPQCQRELDPVPSAILAVGFNLGICGVHPEVSWRTDRKVIDTVEGLRGEPSETLIANCLLLRLSGNLKRCAGYCRWKKHIKVVSVVTGDTRTAYGKCLDSEVTVDFGVPSLCKDELTLFADYVSLLHGRDGADDKKRASRMTNQQHASAIPPAVVQSVAHYCRFVTEWLPRFPGAVAKAWDNAQGHNGNQAAFFVTELDKFLELCCGGHQKQKENGSMFLSQQLYLDLLQVFDLNFDVAVKRPALEQAKPPGGPPRPKKKKRSVPDAPARGADRTNVKVFPPEKVRLHSGSRKGLRYLRKRWGDRFENFESAYETTLEWMDEMNGRELKILGVHRGEGNVYYNAETGEIWSALHYEHWLCKLYLHITHEGLFTFSEQPHSDNGYTHPITMGEGGGEWIHKFSNCPPVAAGMARILDAYANGRDGVMIHGGDGKMDTIGDFVNDVDGWHLTLDEGIFGKSCNWYTPET